jgi:hypothetical protein
MPARPGAIPASPDPLPEGPVGLPGSPVGLPAGANSPLAGPNVLPAGPDLLVPGPAVRVDPMLKLLTGPSPPLLVPVPRPVDDLAEPNCVVVVVEWRVIVVADSCIVPTPSGPLDVEKGLPGAFAPWCVFASAVPAADKATHIAAAVTVPVITTLRVQDRCGMLCLPTMSPLCNKYLEYAAQFLERLFGPKASKSTARNDRTSRIVHHLSRRLFTIGRHHCSRGTSKSTHSARHTSRGSKPSSMACAAVRPPRLVSTWSASTDAPYAAPNCRATSSLNSVRRIDPKLRERLVAHPYRIGDVSDPGARPPRSIPVAWRR